jgi:4-hydroxythreonine-4-phosphate dehydrogenase
MGRPSREAGLCAIEALRRGLLLVETNQADALVTAPVSKESFRMADHGFPGHTEWLAARCQAPQAAMLMVAGPLRAILLTRHVPLVQVAKHLSRSLVQQSVQLGYDFVKKYVASRPKLVLCGLNPHAGDHGIIGKEEQRIYLPAIRSLRKKGISISGPVPADTAFLHMAQGRYDLALAAYHDQGMIPLKLFAPEKVVNITLGLPFIRTSPGHGTAYDIAGKGKADARPMIEAILLAASFVKRGA